MYNDGDSEELREEDASALLVDVVANKEVSSSAIQSDDGEPAGWMNAE